MVREKQVSPNTNAFSWGLHDPGVISIDGVVAEGKSIKEYERSLEEALKQLMETKEEASSEFKSYMIGRFPLLKVPIEMIS